MLDALRRAGRYLLWSALFSAMAALAVFVRSSAVTPVYVSQVELRAKPGGDVSAETVLSRAVAAAGDEDVRSARIVGDRLVIEVAASQRDEAAKRATATAGEVSDTISAGSLRRLDADVARQRQVVLDLEARLPAAPPEARPELERQFSQATETLLAMEAATPDRLELASTPTVPDSPLGPTPARDAAVAFAAALAGSSLLALVVAARSDRFLRGRLSAEVAKLTGAPLLAVVAGDDDQRREAVAAVRGALLLLPDVERLRSLTVVTPDAGDAASGLAWDLALSVSSLDVEVVAVDANLREPRLHQLAGRERAPGLSDVLVHDLSAEMAVAGERPGLLPAGETVDDPMSLLTTGGLRPVLESIPAELVVVDLPVAMRFGDAMAVAPATDATLVVIDPRRTRRRDLADLVRQLRLVGAHVAGVVAVVPT